MTVPRSLFFTNECFGAFADGASKPGEVRVIFPGFVKHDHHRCPASRALRRSLGSQRIKQKVQVGFHGAAPNAARFTTAEAPEGCLTVRGQTCQTLRPSRAFLAPRAPSIHGTFRTCCRSRLMSAIGGILLQKSFGGDERNFLELLMHFVRSDVRDYIASQKNDHGPSYQRYRASQRQGRPKINICEIFSVVRFSTFATVSGVDRKRSAGRQTGAFDPQQTFGMLRMANFS